MEFIAGITITKKTFFVLQVTGFDEQVSKEELQLHFENTRKSDGGEIATCNINREEGIAHITFKDRNGKYNTPLNFLCKCKVSPEQERSFHKKQGLCELSHQSTEVTQLLYQTNQAKCPGFKPWHCDTLWENMFSSSSPSEKATISVGETFSQALV